MLIRASTERSSAASWHIRLGAAFGWPRTIKGSFEMTTANQVYKDVANSPAGRRAAETAKSAADGARSMGEEIGDVGY
jgi:hypothetical protein